MELIDHYTYTIAGAGNELSLQSIGSWKSFYPLFGMFLHSWINMKKRFVMPECKEIWSMKTCLKGF